MFALNPKLKQDNFFIKAMKLSELLLINNNLYPWLVIVPRVEDIREIIELSDCEQLELYNEIKIISKLLKSLYPNSKLNIASIGNIVSQLHIHVIARNEQDETWPSVVWGGKVRQYPNEDAIILINKIKNLI